MRNNIGIVLTVIVLAVSVYSYDQAHALTSMSAATIEDEAPKPNYNAPSFKLLGLDGKSYQVGGRRDKLLLINFWASWCEPCHMEAEDLQSIYNVYRDQLDLYAVNATYMDSRDDAMNFVLEYELTFPTLLDPQGKVTRDIYWIDGYPTSYLINRAGMIVETYFGVIDKSLLEQDIKKWLE